jgi:hypothetical protein
MRSRAHSQLFVSYSRADTAFVDQLEHHLRAQGFFPWVDRSALEGGRTWLDDIQAAIDRSAIVLLVVTPDALKSPWVRSEYRYALNRHKTIIPLLLRTTSLPLELRDVQAVDFRDEFAVAFDQLVKATRVALHPVVRRRRSRALLPWLAGLALFAAGAVMASALFANGFFAAAPLGTSPPGGPRVRIVQQSVDLASNSSVTASCRMDEELLGGGYVNGAHTAIHASYPSSPSSWTVLADQGTHATLTTYAICLRASFRVDEQIITATALAGTLTATCPPNTVLTGGGFRSMPATVVRSEPAFDITSSIGTPIGWEIDEAPARGQFLYYEAYAMCAVQHLVQSSAYFVTSPNQAQGDTQITTGCTPGSILTGGGFDIVSSSEAAASGSVVYQSAPSADGMQWVVGTNIAAVSTQTVSVSAICVTPVGS